MINVEFDGSLSLDLPHHATPSYEPRAMTCARSSCCLLLFPGSSMPIQCVTNDTFFYPSLCVCTYLSSLTYPRSISEFVVASFAIKAVLRTTPRRHEQLNIYTSLRINYRNIISALQKYSIPHCKSMGYRRSPHTKNPLRISSAVTPIPGEATQ
jgi:hypothetical protein